MNSISQDHSQNVHVDSKPFNPEMDGEQIVISGMSGRYPEALNIEEFSDILYNKVDPITEENSRWEFKHSEASKYMGKISDLDRFDAQFFKVHYRQADKMDPTSRKLLEVAYEAIYDAGFNPTEFNEKKVSVFIATGLSETEIISCFDRKTQGGLPLTGCSKTMYANRISYWLNTKGPSVTLDSSSCGSSVALEQAIQGLRRGVCEAAIVGAANVCLLPHTLINNNRCIEIAADGKTKCFSENADGCANSDAINVFLLQKKRDARRIYGEVLCVKNEFISNTREKTGQVYGFKRDLDNYTSFLKQFYEKVDVSPDAVEYIEAFGSGSPDAEKIELQAIEKIFCQNRTEPLYVGSVMSNVGFSNTAATFTGITKVLLGYHRGEIASNLHCEKPRRDVAALRDGRMQLVTEHQPIRSSYAAINGLSVTGINSHILLNGFRKPKDISRYKSIIPRLVTLSARQDTNLQNYFENLKSRPVDPEEIALLHSIHAYNITAHLGRGYIILGTDQDQKTQSLGEKAEYFNMSQRPLWFVFSGMGSQWAGMGAQLMRIPVFAAAIERCNNVLQPIGIDIIDIITSPDKTIFDNILNSFVGIAAIQIGLTDILKELGLTPDNIIGHSVGELGCAYADGCLTAEEMMMSAYCRGKVSLETKLIRGAMAAVGMGYKAISKLCPPDIEVACHNGPESCTISGPANKITEFVAKLRVDHIFAKEVPCANIAYHSRYIAAAGPKLKEYLTQVIKDPKPRSEKWLSTSVPQEKWNETCAKFCSADYLTNNLLNPVFFEETSRLIPKNAVLVEIAPHGLLQAILKRSLSPDCINIPLTKRGNSDSVVFLLKSIGQLYIEGFSPKLQGIYPKVEFPVSSGTPHLSPKVEWMRSDIWTVTTLTGKLIKKAATCNFFINTYDDDYAYLKGNVIQGKVLYPFAAALVAVWDTFVMSIGAKKKDVSVQFQEVHLYSQPILHDQRQLKLNISLHRGNGRFDVLDDGSKVASGFISAYDPNITSTLKQTYQTKLNISAEEVYHNLKFKGYSYGNEFKSIHRVNNDITEAELLWNENWVILIDGMLQLNALKHTYSGLVQPSQIRNLSIDVDKHYKAYDVLSDGTKATKVDINPVIDKTTCGGIVLSNIQFRKITIETPSEMTLELNELQSADLRHLKADKINLALNKDDKIALKIGTVGDINTLHWEKVSNTASGIQVQVYFAGLNVADVKRASGIMPFADDEKYFGMDFSGITKSGERVMGLLKNGAISTAVTAYPNLLWPVPSHWSLEEAATVPLAYAQAFYCLNIKNKLVTNSRVLIHGGAGALGQAAIAIALAMGCTIFTTVADQTKKRFLQRLFPQIPEDHIGNSRDNSFADIVMTGTNGEGCDIILSCVRGDLRNESLKCTAHMGTTVDTSLLQSREDYIYGMSYMTKSRSYMAVDFNSLFESEFSAESKYLQLLVSEGIARGYVRPLSRVTYAPHEASNAFRLLAASRHRGRVLLRLRDQQLSPQPGINCTSNLCHVIFCDGNAAGLQLADRLVARGATALWIHCYDPTSRLDLKMRLWKNQGVKVKATFGKVTDDIFKMLNETTELGQIEGIYIMITNQMGNLDEIAHFVNKIDSITKVSCPQLKYFAITSVQIDIGVETCLSRAADRLPATAIIIPDDKTIFIDTEPFVRESDLHLAGLVAKVNTKHNSAIDKYTWSRMVVDAVERALQNVYPVQIAKPQLLQQMPLLQQLANITGKDSLLSCDEQIALKNIGLENEDFNIIKTYLEDAYSISLEVEDIMKLTKNKICQIELSAAGDIFHDVKGLSTFFSYVDQDELRGTIDLVLLDTLVNTLIGNELDMQENYLSIVPGMEGHHERFRLMCEVLKLPAVVLQPGLDFLNETPKELAQRYSTVLLNKLGLKETFYILGFEYGVAVALELAAILESHGKIGTVFCLGDTPEGIRLAVEKQMANFETEEALHFSIIAHMFRLMSVDDTPLLESAMKDCTSWEERVRAAVSVLLGRVSHSGQYVKAVIEAAYARLNTVRDYRFVPQKLKSKIVLMRTNSPKILHEVETMQQFSEQPVDVFDLAAPLASATQDQLCPGIINHYLSDEILESYTNSNLCISYAVYN